MTNVEHLSRPVDFVEHGRESYSYQHSWRTHCAVPRKPTCSKLPTPRLQLVIPTSSQ